MNDFDKEHGALKDDVYSQANPPREGFTKTDQKHMYRLGKVQELKVIARVGIDVMEYSET